MAANHKIINVPYVPLIINVPYVSHICSEILLKNTAFSPSKKPWLLGSLNLSSLSILL